MDFEFALKSAQTLLDKLELEDAEDKFCKLLSDLNKDEKKWSLDPGKMKSLSMMEVECLIGIADCRSKSFKMGRYLKDDFWFQCFIMPLCLLQKSRKLIQTILEANADGFDKVNGDFQTKVRSRLNRLDFNVSSLEDNFIRGFLRKTFNGNNSGVQRTKPGSSTPINKTWIFELAKVCDVAEIDGWSKKKKSEPKQPTPDAHESEDVQSKNKLTESRITIDRKTDRQQRLKSSQSFKHQRPLLSTRKYRDDTLEVGESTGPRDISPNPSAFSNKSRTINFERFQEAIKTFVSDISSEVRTRYGHLSKVPESLIERRLASEIALRLSPGSIQAEDYINVLEGALVAGITSTADDQIINDDKEDEKVAEMQRMAELQREKERLLALDDEGDEDDNSYETLHFDVGNCLQSPISDCANTSDEKSESSKQLAVTWTKYSTLSNENSLKVVVPRSQGLPVLAATDKTLPVPQLGQTLKQLRRDILFVWRRLQIKEHLQEINASHQMDVRDNHKILSVKNEDHFEELSNLNQRSTRGNNDCHVNVKVTIEDSSWPFQKIKKSNIILMFIELLIKAAKYESLQDHHFESVELLQIADKIINEHWDVSCLESEAKEIVALVWGDLGEELSKTGQVSKGSSYLEKQKSLTLNQESKLNGSSNNRKELIFEEVEMWSKLGDAYLAEDLRSESLLARLMQLTKEELIRLDETSEHESKSRSLMDQYISDLHTNKDCKSFPDNFKSNSDDEVDDDDEKTERDVYCTCLQEAVDCFTTAANILQANRSLLGNDRPELWSEILTKMADCHLMCGNLDLAETAYDGALDHVSRAVGPEHLRRNADAILALATLCFITGNNIRACTLLLTSLALRGKYCDKRGLKNTQSDYNRINTDPYSLIKLQHSLDLEEDETDFATVWTMMILTLAHHSLGKPHQAISWASRAFTAHGQFFHGRLVAVDFLNRWFLVRILLSWATNHIVLSNPHESVNRLIISQKLLDVSGGGDRFQMSQILKVFGDAYLLLSSGIGLNPEVDTGGNTRTKYLEKSKKCYSKALEILANDKAHHDKLLNRINFFKAHKKYSLDNKLDKYESQQLQITWVEDKDEKMKSERIPGRFDLILILLEMANDHVANYNLDQSLACFVECSRELEKSWAAEGEENEGFLLASVYFRLGRLLHVKYLMSCDQPDELQCYSDASIRVFDLADDIARKLISSESERLHLDILVAKSCLLYDLDKKYEAVQISLPVLLKNNDEEITFSGQEMFALPKQLRSIFTGNNFDSTLTIKRQYLLGLLATTCFREMGLMDFATESICSMIRNFNPKSGIFLDHVSIAFSFMNLGFYDDAYRVFSDLSRICDERGRKYLSLCAYVCLLLHLRSIVQRMLWIVLEKTFLNLKKTFRLLTFGEFLHKVLRGSKMCTNGVLDVPKISVRSTSPKLKWSSGSCRQENARRSPNSVPFKIETGVTSRKLKEIPTRSFFAPPSNISNLASDRQNRPQQSTQIFSVI